MENCDNCKADGKEAIATIRLGDGMWLCAACWEDVKDDCEPIEGGCA
jgi:hypothetical protein